MMPCPAPASPRGLRVSLRDIARNLNVSHVTVSLALRDDPRIRLERRREIQAAAKALGYEPDPMLASLSAYRQAKRTKPIHSTVAWLNHWPDAKGLRAIAQVVTYKRNPLSHAYVMSRADELKDLLEDAGGILDTSTKPTNDGRTIDFAPGIARVNQAVIDVISSPTGILLSDGTKAQVSTVNDAVNAYNRIWVNLDKDTRQTESYDLDRLTAKLVTDYTFQSGPLKGFRAGLAVSYIQRDRAGYRGGETIANPAYNPKWGSFTQQVKGSGRSAIL